MNQRELLKAASPPGQKYLMGDFVKIADDLGSMMSHFPRGFYAQVQTTYASQYGGGDIKNYTLKVRHEKDNTMISYHWYKHYDFYWSNTSWYKVDQLTLVDSLKLTTQFIKELEYQNNKDVEIELERRKQIIEKYRQKGHL